MTIPEQRPEQGPLGLTEDRRAYNRLRDYVLSLTPRDSPTVHPEWTLAGTSWQAAPAADVTPGKVTQYLVKAIKRDHLECVEAEREADGTITETGDTVDIAKPYELQVYHWWGKTIEGMRFTFTGLTVSDSATVNLRDREFQRRMVVRTGPSPHSIIGTEGWNSQAAFFQEVWPPYIADETIICAADVENGYALDLPIETFQTTPTLIQGPALTVKKIDLNVAGRTWLDINNEFITCVVRADGTTARLRVRIRSSQPYPLTGS